MAVILFWPHWVRFELTQYWALSIELQEHNNASDLWTQAAELDSEIFKHELWSCFNIKCRLTRIGNSIVQKYVFMLP